jgi:hypothetical protein
MTTRAKKKPIEDTGASVPIFHLPGNPLVLKGLIGEGEADGEKFTLAYGIPGGDLIMLIGGSQYRVSARAFAEKVIAHRRGARGNQE